MVRDMDRWRQLISEYGRLQQLLGHTPQSRGQRFNTMIAELLRCWGIQATANVRAAGEVDVAFAIDGVRFVVEAKWEKPKADTGRVAKLQKRVRQRLSGTYGVFLSMSGYTPEALADVADGDRLEVLLLSGEHWEAMLGGLVPPQELFNLVRDRASFYGEPYTPLARLFTSAGVPEFSFDPPSEMTGGPLLAAVDGVEAQVVLSGIESGQLGIACHRQGGLLVTTEQGVLDVDLESRTAEIAVPVPERVHLGLAVRRCTADGRPRRLPCLISGHRPEVTAPGISVESHGTSRARRNRLPDRRRQRLPSPNRD